jgi:hypothetical protein
MSFSHKFIKIGKYVGTKFNKITEVEKSTRNLIIVFDNLTFNNIFFPLLVNNIPRIIKNNSNKINYKEIRVTYSHPSINNREIFADSAYGDMSKLIKFSHSVISSAHFLDLLKYTEEGLNIFINENNDIPVDILMFSAVNLYLPTDDMKTILSNISAKANVTYFDLGHCGALNNITQIIIDDPLQLENYFQNFDIISKQLNNNEKSIQELNFNGVHPLSYKFLTASENNTAYCILDKISLDKIDATCVMGDEIYNFLETDEYTNDNIIKYLENTVRCLDNIILVESNIKYYQEYVTELQKIIKEIYNHSQTNNNIECIRNLSWIFVKLKTFTLKLASTMDSFSIDDKTNNEMVNLFNTYRQNTFQNANKNYMTVSRINKNKNLVSGITKIDDIIESNEFADFIKVHDELVDQYDTETSFIKSCEIFNSLFTLSNWYDEIKNKSSLGLLISITRDEMTKLGIGVSKPIVHNITASYIPVKDYLEASVDFFKKNTINGENFGELNGKNIILDKVMGNGNAVVPLFINKQHWKITKTYLEALLGIILADNPLLYTPSHLNFMFFLLTDMTRKAFTNENILSEAWLQCYMALWRTCCEISYEKGYHKGIHTLINDFINSPIKRLNARPFDHDVLLGQILSTGCKFNEETINKICKIIYEDLIRRRTSKSYGIDYFNYLVENEQLKHDETIALINYVSDALSIVNDIIVSFKKMYLIFTELFQHSGSYFKFLGKIDTGYGAVPNDIIKLIYSKIVKNPITVTYNDAYMSFGITNKINERMILDIFQAIESGNNKLRKKAIENNSLIQFNESMTIDTIFDIYINKFKKD